MHYCSNQGESDDNDGERADGRVDPITHLAGQHSRQRALRNDGEYGRVVVFKRSQKRQNGRRGNSRLQEGQKNFSEDLGMRGPQIQGRLFKAGIKALQSGQEDQHGVGRDKSRLANNGHEVAVVKKAVLCTEYDPIDSFPKDERRDAENHARNQNRRNRHRIHHRARAFLQLGQQKRCRQSYGHREQYHPNPYKQTATQATHQMLILDQDIKPLARDAVPG